MCLQEHVKSENGRDKAIVSSDCHFVVQVNLAMPCRCNEEQYILLVHLDYTGETPDFESITWAQSGEMIILSSADV